MKLLLVTAKEETRDKIFNHFNRLGYDIIIYDNPLKAMDNLSEIAPDAVLFNAEDFPRHWKPFVQVLRQLFDRDSSVFVILKGDAFADDDAVKAGMLSVNGVISENFDSRDEITQLENILSRYLVHTDSRGARRYNAEINNSIEFLFNHPENYTLISGSVSDVSFDGIRIIPDHPQHSSDIKEGTKINSCSIRFGDYICSVGVRVVRNNKSISFRFTDFDESDRDCFIDFLDTITYRNHVEMKS